MSYKRKTIVPALFLLLLVAVVGNAAVGSADISLLTAAKIAYMGTLEWVRHIILNSLYSIAGLFDQKFISWIGYIFNSMAVYLEQSRIWDALSVTRTWETKYDVIVMQIRIPRALLAALVGAALSTAGCAMQALLKNPMADPYIIGMSSGASLGAALALLIGLHLQFTAFLFSLVTIFLVYNIAKIGRSVPVDTLLLAGIAVAAFLSAVTSFLVYVNESREHVIIWMMGGFWSPSWEKVFVSGIMVLVGTLMLYRHAWSLNVLLLGEEQAQYLGINIERVKVYILVFSSLITGAAVAVSGLIGFVGLIIPHIMRILVGPDHRVLFPASTLAGAIFLVLCDTLSKTIVTIINLLGLQASITTLPVGIITAFFGAPFFIYLLRKRRKSIDA